MEFLFRLGLWISGRVMVDLAEVGCTQRWCLVYFGLDVLAITCGCGLTSKGGHTHICSSTVAAANATPATHPTRRGMTGKASGGWSKRSELGMG